MVNVRIVIIRKHFFSLLRWGLRIHGISHLIEVIAAISEGALITASIALFFITIEILASFFIPDQHVHIKPFKSEVHENCKKE